MQAPPLPDLATRKALRAALLTFRNQAKIGFESMAKRYLLPALPAEVVDSYDGEPLSAERVKRALHGWVMEDRDIARHPWILAAVEQMLQEHGSPTIQQIADPSKANRETGAALARFLGSSKVSRDATLSRFCLTERICIPPGIYVLTNPRPTEPAPDELLFLYDVGLDHVMVAHHLSIQIADGRTFVTGDRGGGFLFLNATPLHLLTRSAMSSQARAWRAHKHGLDYDPILFRLAAPQIADEELDVRYVRVVKTESQMAALSDLYEAFRTELV